jgi:uncharacterized membrane protein YgdD (TMEM256/DUF423 family)
MTPDSRFRLSALIGFAGVVLGAFGAHGLKSVLTQHNTAAIWETAVLYHLTHAIVLLVVARDEAIHRWAWFFFVAGITIFSGSLYVLALSNVRWLGAITPIGGICLLLGWIVLALRPSQR